MLGVQTQQSSLQGDSFGVVGRLLQTAWIACTACTVVGSASRTAALAAVVPLAAVVLAGGVVAVMPMAAVAAVVPLTAVVFAGGVVAVMPMAAIAVAAAVAVVVAAVAAVVVAAVVAVVVAAVVVAFVVAVVVVAAAVAVVVAAVAVAWRTMAGAHGIGGDWGRTATIA